MRPADLVRRNSSIWVQRPDGLILALAEVPGRHWRDGFGPALPDPKFVAPNGQHRRVHQLKDADVALAAHLVVIDPVAGRILADTLIDRHLVWFADADHVVGYTERDGEPIVTVWRIALSRRKT